MVWVNIHRPPYNGVSWAGFNRALDQISASAPNLAVVDWNGMVNSGQAQVAPDGVHPTPDGYRARAAAIAQALQGCSTQRASAGGAAGGSHTIKPASPQARDRHPEAQAGTQARRPEEQADQGLHADHQRRRSPRRPPRTTPARAARLPGSPGGALLALVLAAAGWFGRGIVRNRRGPS